MVDLTCQHCGTTFWVHRYLQHHAKFCSHPCAAAHRRIPRKLCACGCGHEIPYNQQTKRGHKPLGTHGYRKKGLRLAHRMRAERALGRPLLPEFPVHHADGSTSEHAPLVICQDQAYHLLLHARMRIVRAGGNPDTHRICCRCKKLVLAEEMSVPEARTRTLTAWCKSCNREVATINRRKRGIPTKAESNAALRETRRQALIERNKRGRSRRAEP